MNELQTNGTAQSPDFGSGANEVLTLRPYHLRMALSGGSNFCAPTSFPAGEYNI
jgi:hypothetical protein